MYLGILRQVLLADGPRGCDMLAAAFNAAYDAWANSGRVRQVTTMKRRREEEIWKSNYRKHSKSQVVMNAMGTATEEGAHLLSTEKAFLAWRSISFAR